MSSWTRETTADIGLRVFSNNLPNLFKEAAIGMQNLIISDLESRQLNQKNTSHFTMECENPHKR